MNLEVEKNRSETGGKDSFPNNILPGWKEVLKDQLHEEYFKKLGAFLKKEYAKKAQIFPAQTNILRSLKELDYDDVRVVILGQDPYHGAGQAIGRAFAVPDELTPKPPSLKNIFKEVENDLRTPLKNPSSELSGWVKQGVLLLNTVLTVRSGQAFSHRNQGWETFTDKIIAALGDRAQPIVFILWGAAAQSKRNLIKNPAHLLLQAPHPSPLSASRGFFGSKPFSKTNEFLAKKLHQEPIDWARTR